MHHIFHTEGIILESRNYREADKCYFIFTRDFGLVFASAQGVRKITSKMRFVLQDFTYVKVDLVQGRQIWRLTQASKTGKLENVNKDWEKLRVTANIAKLLKRLLQGEESNVELFDEVISGLSLLERAQNKNEIKNVELVLVLKILNNLGYVGEKVNTDELVLSPFSDEILLKDFNNKKDIIREINAILQATQL